jgi:hypothetical protein
MAWLKRSANRGKAPGVIITTEVSADPAGRGEWSTPVGVIIDGAAYSLEGEPAPMMPTVHYGGNGQR